MKVFEIVFKGGEQGEVIAELRRPRLRLKGRDRRLIVGRAECGYSYRQLAFMERLSSAEAARKAMGRALRRLIDTISRT